MEDRANRTGLGIALLICVVNVGTVQAAGRFVVGIGGGRSAVDGVTDTDPTPSFTLPQLPSEISLNGLPFDDNDVAGQIFVRYEFIPRAGVEVGYWDLGEFENSNLVFGRTAKLSASEWYAEAFYRLPISRRFNVKGSLGAAYAEFDASGRTAVLGFGAFPPLARLSPDLVLPPAFVGVSLNVLNPAVYFAAPLEFPLASPDSEVGVILGVALEWQLTDRWALELSYDQHRIKVQDVESLSLGISAGF